MAIDSRSFVALVATAFISSAAFGAKPSPSAKLEVEQLLARVAASGCRFQRNGVWHNAANARAHLEKKYQYLLDKHLVGTSEDFISRAATKSSTSGKPYLVKCANQEQMTSARWMAAELKKLRATKQDASTAKPGGR